DPARLARRPRQPTIQRHPALCDDKRASTDNPFVKSLVKLRAFVSQNTLSHSGARISQLHDTFAGVARIHVPCADNYASHSGPQYCVSAGSSAPGGGTRFQSNVQRGPSRHRRGEIAEALNLSVIAPRSPMMSFRHYSIVN